MPNCSSKQDVTNWVVDPAADLSKGLNAFVMLSTKERNTKGVGYVLSSQIDLSVAFFLMLRVFRCMKLL